MWRCAGQYRIEFQHFFFFGGGTLFLKKLYLKNFNIKNKNNKISQGRGKNTIVRPYKTDATHELQQWIEMPNIFPCPGRLGIHWKGMPFLGAIILLLDTPDAHSLMG